MILSIDTKSMSGKTNTLSMSTCVEKCFTKAMEEFSNIEKSLRVNSIWGKLMEDKNYLVRLVM